MAQKPFLRLRALSQRSWMWASLTFILTLGAYARTLLPGVVGGDAGELQFASYIYSIVHTPGDPLYVTLGFMWARLVPFGTVAYRMNLLAAVSGATACAIATALIHRLYRSWSVALASGLSLGFGATFWGQAVIADKYAFNTIFVVAVVGLSLIWLEQRTLPHGNRLLYALCLVYGISLLHHITMILLGVMIALLIAWHERSRLWRDWRRTLLCLLLALLPALIVYPIYLPLAQARNLSPILWRPTTIAEWVGWMLNLQYSTAAFALDSLPARLAYYASTLWADYTIAIVVISLLGLFMTIRQRAATGLFLLATFLVTAGLSANYRAYEQPYYFFLPSFIVMIYAYAAGLNGLLLTARQKLFARPRFMRLMAVTGAALALIIPAAQFAYAYPIQRLASQYGPALDVYRQSLKSGDLGDRLAEGMILLPENAVVLGDWEQLTVLWYYQKVNGLRPDLTLVYPIDRLGDYKDSRRPLCLMRYLPIGPEWHPTNVGALVCLQEQARRTLPDGLTPVGTKLYATNAEPRLELVGYQIITTSPQTWSHIPITLVWRALDDHLEDYSISLHILTEQWQPIWQRDIAAPVLGMYPTSRWEMGEVVADYHEFDIERDMPPGRYLWTVVVYRRLDDGSFVQLRDEQGNIEILGGTLEVVSR